VVFGAAMVALVATYPVTRGDVLQRCYLAAELAALVVAIGCCVQFAWRQEPPRLPHGCTILIGCVEVAMIIGPYRKSVFASWDLAQIAYTILYVTLAVVLGGSLWGTSSSQKSS